MFKTIINGHEVKISEELVEKYDIAAPRYTSYPTAPVWGNVFGPSNFANALNELGANPLSLYFHIPFCRQRCLFCGCSTIATTNKDVAERYCKALCNEIALVRKEIKKSSPVEQIHFGGGTPTYLSCGQISTIWNSISSNFNIAKNAEIGIEVDPRVTTFEHLELLAKLGFNRISIGIQDLSIEVQNAIGRVESFEHVEELIGKSRSVGFKSINIDLVYGLPFQTKETFELTLKKILELSPDRIACFNFAYLPKLLPHQNKLPKEALPGRDLKFEMFCKTIEILAKANYDFIGIDHFAKSTDELSVAAKNKTLWRNFQGYTTKAGTDLIGFGMTAISDVSGSYAQNAKRLSEYYSKIESNNFATVKGWKLSDDDIVRRKMIRELFCNGETQTGNLKFQISDLKKDGLVNLNDNKLQVTPLGRLFVRNIATILDAYLPEINSVFSRAV